MILDAHPGEGQPVQRRVSYRRLREEENAKAMSSGGDSAPLLPAKGVLDGDNRGNEENLGADIATSNPSSIGQEVWLAVREGIWYMLLTAVVGGALSFFAVVHLSSHESGTGAADTPRLPARRIPSAEEQVSLHDSWMRGATTIHVGEGGRGTVILQGGTAASKEGHLRLPGQFYQGLHFGISAWNTWGEKLTDKENRRRNSALREVLESLDPRPSDIYPTVFEGGVEGFTAAFTAGALGKQEKRSVRERSDPVWGEAEGAVLTAARQFQQLTVWKWHPKVWGPGHHEDEHLHTSVLQEVLPTRTGLRKLSSTVAVYRVLEGAAPGDEPRTTTKTATATATATATTRKTTGTGTTKAEAKAGRVVSRTPN